MKAKKGISKKYRYNPYNCLQNGFLTIPDTIVFEYNYYPFDEETARANKKKIEQQLIRIDQEKRLRGELSDVFYDSEKHDYFVQCQNDSIAYSNRMIQMLQAKEVIHKEVFLN